MVEGTEQVILENIPKKWSMPIFYFTFHLKMTSEGSKRCAFSSLIFITKSKSNLFKVNLDG